MGGHLESLVEGFENAVEVAVALSLLAVPVDGLGVGMGGRTEGDRREVIDIEESDANAGKERRPPSRRVAVGGSQGHAGGGGTDAKSGRVSRSGSDGTDLTDEHTGCRERTDNAAELIACRFQERSCELRSAEVKGESDDGASPGGVIVQCAGSREVGQHNDRRRLRRRLRQQRIDIGDAGQGDIPVKGPATGRGASEGEPPGGPQRVGGETSSRDSRWPLGRFDGEAVTGSQRERRNGASPATGPDEGGSLVVCAGHQRCPTRNPKSLGSLTRDRADWSAGRYALRQRDLGQPRSIHGSCRDHLGGPLRGIDIEEAGTGGQSPIDSRGGAPAGGNEVAQSAVGAGDGWTPRGVPGSDLVDREHPVERLAGDLLHPLVTESLAHCPGRRLTASVHADRCQTERPAMPVDRDDGLSLAAEGDRSYRISSASSLYSHCGDK